MVLKLTKDEIFWIVFFLFITNSFLSADECFLNMENSFHMEVLVYEFVNNRLKKCLKHVKTFIAAIKVAVTVYNNKSSVYIFEVNIVEVPVPMGILFCFYR